MTGDHASQARLSTSSLELRPWSEADSVLLATLAADPRVVRFVGDGTPWDADRVDQVHAWILGSWREQGFGWFVVEPSTSVASPLGLDSAVGLESAVGRDSAVGGLPGSSWKFVLDPAVGLDPALGRRLGLVALNLLGPGAAAGYSPTEHELGWWLAPAAWGHGLAAEAAMAVRNHAFSELGVSSLIARIQRRNGASIAVARRVGMEHERDSSGRFGESIAVYRVSGDRPGPVARVAGDRPRRR